MRFLTTKVVAVILILTVVCSCNSKKTTYYDSGEIRDISFFHFNNKNPYNKKEFTKDGRLKSSMIFDEDGFLSSGLELSDNGDSIVSIYSNKANNSYSIIYTKRGDVFYYPYENKKLTGVVRYYKKSILKKRFLYIQDSIMAIEFYDDLEEGKKIVIEEFRNNKVHERVFVNEKFNKYVSQYLANSDRQLIPCGTYFLHKKSSKIDTVFSDFILMDLPDTLTKGEIVKGKIFGNHWKKKDLYLEYYLNEVNAYPKNSLNNENIKSPVNSLSVDFEFRAEKTGYNFICSHAILRNRDSTIFQDFFVYDDFYVKEK